MLLTKFENIAIDGMSVALPKQRLMLETFKSSFGEEAVNSIIQMTGIKSVYRAKPEQTASDLGYEAAIDVISKARIDTKDIGLLVFVTQKPDYRVPSTAFVLHKRLGLKKECSCFDINIACQGFVFGLQTVMAMLNHSNEKTALLVTGDTSVRTISPFDRSMIMLFGDNGTATLLSKQPASTNFCIALQTDSSKFKSVIIPSGAYRNRQASFERREMNDGIVRSDYDIQMNGMDVFGWSISAVPQLMNDFLLETKTGIQDYDCVALHQPNMYILKKISRKVRIPEEKLLVSLENYGNNSSSSIPLVLADHYGKSEAGMLRVLICGFGSGLSLACGAISINANKINQIIFTDNYYKEAIL